MPMVRKIASIAGTALLFLLVLLCLAVTIVPPFLDTRYYEGPDSGHYDGQRFFNPDQSAFNPPSNATRTDLITRFLFGDADLPYWPDAVAVKPSRPAATASPEGMRATWVGHATVLVQAAGINILTDPVWSDVVGPFPPIGPKRRAEPGIRFDDLPKIDLVILSHNHYDHFDIPTLKRLWDRDHPAIVTGLGNESILAANGIKATALDWGQSVYGGALAGYGNRATVTCENYRHCPDYRVHLVRNHHWDSRWGVDRNRALWASFFIETRAGNIYFAGDTGPGDMKWAGEAAKLGPIRLAIIPIGAFRFSPGEMVNANHIGPREAVRVFQDLNAGFAIPIHWGTFRLSREAWDTPPKMLHLFMQCAGLPVKSFAPMRFGQSVDVPEDHPPVAGRPEIDPAICRDGSAKLAALK